MTETSTVLLVDLSAGSWRAEEVDTAGALGLGGKVLGIRLLERYLDARIDPLASDNVVAITPSPLAAYSMSGSNRFGAFTKSPLTGIWLEAYCGGTFARTLTETGWGAVVIVGAAAAPVHLHITAEGARFLPAGDLWGKDTFAVEAELLARLETRSSVLCIGVAGENLVKVASVMHERAHTLGRGGMGAVFGSKKLKAVSVTSPGALKGDAQEQFVQTRREVSKLATESPASDIYRRQGTAMMTALVNEARAFPTDFFTSGVAPHRDTLEAEHWPEWTTLDNYTCPPCQLRCRKRLTLTEGPEAGREMHGPEYETIYAFGGSCMVEHARDVAKLNERCNMLGMDTISSGNLAAVAIRARQAGRVPNGPGPGDVEGISQLLEEIATRATPTGSILAEGMDDALARFGVSEWSVTSKRLDPAGYDPRKLKGMALSYALSARGACHLRATFYKPELMGLLDGMDDDTYVQTYIDWEDRMVLMDGLTMCRFYRDFMSWDRIISAAGQLNGAPVTKEQLERLSTETITRIRRLSLAAGLSPASDTVAERFFLEPSDAAPALDREELRRRVSIYWAKRGWTEEGLLPAD
jgi:aldehyde:ferredoxin oxidoreductase